MSHKFLRNVFTKLKKTKHFLYYLTLSQTSVASRSPVKIAQCDKVLNAPNTMEKDCYPSHLQTTSKINGVNPFSKVGGMMVMLKFIYAERNLY